MCPLTTEDHPDQLYILRPAPMIEGPAAATLQRRQGAATMVAELIANCDLTIVQIAAHLGVTPATVARYLDARTSPGPNNYEQLWRTWNYFMSKAQVSGRAITHPTKG